MVYRSIIQLSPTTKVVSMPSSWLLRNGVKKGDYVDVEERGSRILISATAKRPEHVSSDIRKLSDDLVWTAIDSLYMLGYSDIELRLSDSQKRLMPKVIKFFPMLIIESESGNIISLKSVASSIEVDFDKALQRIRHMTSSMTTEALVHIKSKNWTSLKKIKKIDYQLNTYVSMCFRYMQLGKIEHAMEFAQFVKILETYADRLCIMCAYVASQRGITKGDVEVFTKLNSLYNNSFKLLAKFSINSANVHDFERRALESSFKGSRFEGYFLELTRSIFDMQEIIFSLNMPI